MSLYCGTFDVTVFGQVEYHQIGFSALADFNSWLAGTLIPKAMEMVDNYVGHNFQYNDGTIRLDGSGKEALHLSRVGLVNTGVGLLPPRLLPVPMLTVTAVSIDGVAQTVTDFQVYDEIVTYEDNCFCAGRQNVDIVGDWGYTTIPHDIQYVTSQLCSNALTEMVRRRMLPDLITPVMEGGGAVHLLFRSPKVLTENEMVILDRYRFREYAVG